MDNPNRLSDRELEAEVARLARCERDATALLVAHLAELYGRRLHEQAGYSSLFTYCLEVLRCSEHEAYDRMKAAKVAWRYPQVLEWLASSELNLTTVRLLAPHLTRTNHAGLFDAARGKRKRQVQELLASRFPKPDVAPSIRKRPARPIPVAPVAPVSSDATVARPIDVPERPPIPSPPPPLVRPLAPERYQITFTGSAHTRELLELARDLLRHAVPGGDPAEIVTRALEVLVQDLLKKKFAVTNHPRGPAPASDSRYVPADVKRAVYLRDGGRCAFVGGGGRRCGERAFLEFDHHPVPYAAGGRSTVDNLQLRCRTHNRYLADRFFSPAHGDACRSGTTERATPPVT